MITAKQLEQILVDHGLVEPAAVEDPEGYDEGVTLQKILKIAHEINEVLP